MDVRFKAAIDDMGAIYRILEFEDSGDMLSVELGNQVAKPGVIYMRHMDTVIAVGVIARQLLDGSAGVCGVYNTEIGLVDKGIVVGGKGVARLMMDVKGLTTHAGND